VYDPAWPASYDEHRRRITTALGAGARSVENIGSTAVPGLSAKPIIDILVTVPDITAEEDHLPGSHRRRIPAARARARPPHGPDA
jgi:GrpB-like predicted nucleotidyltransferase (UPF0157 family)